MSQETHSHEFCWQELATPNLQASKDFYGKVFGWEFIDQDMGDMVYTMVKHKDKPLHVGFWSIPKEMQKQIPPHWLSYISVDHLEKALEKASKSGATIVKPISNAGECGRFAVIQDPTGAHVALWESKKECCS